MAEERQKPTQNNQFVSMGVSNDAALEPRMLRVDPTTNRLLVDVNGGAADGDPFTAGTSDGNPMMGVYEATPTTVTDNDFGVVGIDTNRNLKVREQYSPVAENNTSGVIGVILKPVNDSTYSPSNYKDAGTVTKANVKASAGNVYSLRITNENAAARYFQLHNKATAPAAAETALRYWKIPGGTATVPGVLELDNTYFSPSQYHTTGIGWAISTVSTTFTDSATASEHNVDINYV